MKERIQKIMNEHRGLDNSFKEKGGLLISLLGGIKYSQSEAREIWFSGIEYGVELGLNKASLDGQKVEIYNNCKNKKHKEFLDEFYKLAEKYNCYVQYHPLDGMVVIDKR